MSNPFNTPLQQLQYIDKYARYNRALGRRETWAETTDRVIDYMMKAMGEDMAMPYKISHQDWSDLEEAMLKLEVLPSMRIVQMAGPTLDRCNVGAYNCAYLPLDSWEAFAELLYILMQGTGVGFSVESQYIDKLPRIRKQRHNAVIGTFAIEDTTEGWCDALKFGMLTWASGNDTRFDYSAIRPEGSDLITKGGKASGPAPLKQLLDTVRGLMLRRQGDRLSTVDAHDIACLCGSIVQVGGVRRAAEISLSDLDDRGMRDCKQGPFWTDAPHRAMANNSAVYEEKPSAKEFLEEWLSLIKSGTGERGIFNRGSLRLQIPNRRFKHKEFGVNPCGEIILRPRQFCNLSIAVARHADTLESLTRKVQLATIWGVLQSTLTNFNYISSEWKKNCEEERLLGVDITGQMDCPTLTDPNAAWVFSELRKTAVRTAMDYADKLNINRPAAVTCVKPSGNSSQLLDCSSGVHPRYAPYYIRRLRIGARTPVGEYLRRVGVPWHPEVGQSESDMSVMVVEVPVKAPEGAQTREKYNAVRQLSHWLVVKNHWTEHNPSATIYVEDDEWLKVGEFVYSNWDSIGGLSFLPKDGGIYTLAPYEEITKDEYEKRVAAFPALDFAGGLIETSDHTDIAREFSCVGDKCEL